MDASDAGSSQQAPPVGPSKAGGPETSNTSSHTQTGRTSTKLGDVTVVAETDSAESVQWRLNELEARSRWLEQLDQKFSSIITEIVSSEKLLWKQVVILERTLGLPTSQKEALALSSISQAISQTGLRAEPSSLFPASSMGELSPTASLTSGLPTTHTSNRVVLQSKGGGGKVAEEALREEEEEAAQGGKQPNKESKESKKRRENGAANPEKENAATTPSEDGKQQPGVGGALMAVVAFPKFLHGLRHSVVDAGSPPAALYGASSARAPIGAAEAVGEAVRDGLGGGDPGGQPSRTSSSTRPGEASNASSANGNNSNNSSNNNNNSSNSNSNSHVLDLGSRDVSEQPEAMMMEAHIKRVLSPSVWNAAFLIGMHRTGWAASLTIGLLLFFNISMQCTFLGIIVQIIGEELFNENELVTLKNWRYFVGQSVNYYDPLTRTSLAQRICASAEPTSHLPVELSDSKAQLVVAIKAYLPASDDFFATMFSGPSLSMIALIFWTLKVFTEILDTIDTAVGMMSVPRGARNLVVESETGMFRFASLRRKQKIFIGFILIVRVSVCLLLWVLGCSFLLNYSIEPAELILNAVALEIVLNVDEVLFSLVPLSTKHLLMHMEPLPGPPTVKHFRGLDKRTAIVTTFLLFMFVLFYIGGVQPLVDRIKAAESELCDGQRHVIFATDPYQFVYSATLEQNDGGQTNVNVATETAVEELVYPELVPIRNYSGIQGHYDLGFPQVVGDPPSYLRQVALMTNSEAAVAIQEVEMGVVCEDIMRNQILPFMQTYMLAYGVEGASSCADLVHLCVEVPIIRVVCPITCGCDSPFGLVFDIDGDTGCPSRCLEAGRWPSIVSSLPCKDTPVSELQASSYWHSWVRQFTERLAYIGAGFEDAMAIICSKHGGNCTRMFESGCDFVTDWAVGVKTVFGDYYEPSACTGKYFGSAMPTIWRPFAPICPERCGCLENPHLTTSVLEDSPVAICPSTCEAGTSAATNATNATNETDIDNDTETDE